MTTKRIAPFGMV